MLHGTMDKKQPDHSVLIECVRNAPLETIDNYNECFLLIVITAGNVSFSVNGKTVKAIAPAFLCFSEKHSPVFTDKEDLQYYAIYFHPTFLNINMTFERIRDGSYSDITYNHNLFLLRPFLEVPCSVIPISIEYLNRVETSCADLLFELQEQRDSYWPCRSRSYFLEIIIALERIYNFLCGSDITIRTKNLTLTENVKLNDAVRYIESHYADDISLADIATACRMNRTTLAALFKKGLDKTVFHYLMEYRIFIAKKQLSFTAVPLKDISARCGFKTVQHFTRIFKNQTGETPARYRIRVLKERIQNLKNE